MIRKRSNSFDDEHFPQSKTHISQKEVNLGINKDENMRLVYAKTLERLFKGSQKNENVETGKSSEDHQGTESSHYKQMFLNNKCQLQEQGNLENVINQSPCGLCARVSTFNRECSFCEKNLCEECILTCKKCRYPFCTSCIFSMYEETEEYTICRSCY